MNRRTFLRQSVALPIVFGTTAAAFGQLQFESEATQSAGGPQLGESKTQRWKAGIKILANGSALDQLTIIAPIPADWPEQQTRIADEKSDPGVRLAYKDQPGCRVLHLSATKYRANRETEMYVTVQTTKYQLLPPGDIERYAIPSRGNRLLNPYLSKGPRIESDNKKFAELFKEITADLRERPDWLKIRAIYDYVRETITYDGSYKSELPKGALATLTDGQNKGDCKDMTCLFAAICRAGKIPARAVRVPNHCYAEFYLEEKPPETPAAGRKKGRSGTPDGYWFPCQLAGDDEFGGISDVDPILQKGDNFPEIDDPKIRNFYVTEQFHAAGTNGIDPRFTFIHELRGT